MAGLIFSSMAALASTMWGVASCQYVFVDFVSDRGDFSDFYLDPTPDGSPVKYRAGAGLFTWLQPFDELDWSKGQCTGYTELHREHFSDNSFEVARIFAVLSVLGGIGVTSWTLFLACISLGKFQIWMLSTILGLQTIFVGLTFLLFKSELCQDIVSYQDETYTTDCTLDQGGLVVIAGVILWCVACLISIIYIKPPETEMQFTHDGRITNAFQQRKEQRSQAEKERRLKQLLADQQRQQRQIRQNRSMPSPTSQQIRQNRSLPSVTSQGDGNGTEVYLEDDDYLEDDVLQGSQYDASQAEI
jgi:hypothetical protein